MRKALLCVTSFLVIWFAGVSGQAQDKPKAEDKPSAAIPTTPVKLLVLFTEFEGEKKVKSLPYTLYINAQNADELKPGWTRTRIGSRVPIYVGNNQMQYIDIGTNIDARASYTSEGRLLLSSFLERSWIEGDVPISIGQPAGQAGDSHIGQFREPIFRTHKWELDLKLREGQNVESTMATDPLSGRVLKVEMSFTLAK